MGALTKQLEVQAKAAGTVLTALESRGLLGVSTVVDGSVKFLPVTIASDTREGVWVLGLPLSVDIITVGQEYVTDGQSVDATNVPVETATVTAS